MIEFQEFWAAYPRKVAKKDAESAWKKLTPNQQTAAMEALPKHVRNWDDKTFIPYPATWLRGERWEDEIEERPKLKVVEPAWWASDEGIIRKGEEIGIYPRRGETMANFRARVSEGIKAA